MAHWEDGVFVSNQEEERRVQEDCRRRGVERVFVVTYDHGGIRTGYWDERPVDEACAFTIVSDCAGIRKGA